MMDFKRDKIYRNSLNELLFKMSISGLIKGENRLRASSAINIDYKFA